MGSLEVQLHAFLTSILDGVKWSASLHSRFTPGEIIQVTRWTGSWMGFRVGMDVSEKIKSSCSSSSRNWRDNLKGDFRELSFQIANWTTS
jgi:hypothetical protein